MKRVLLSTAISMAMLSTAALANNIGELDLEATKAKNAEIMSKASESYKQSSGSKLNLGAVPAPMIQIKDSLTETAASYGKKLKRYQVSDKPKYKLNLFVSFSMPEASIKKYIRDAAKLGRDNITLSLVGFKKGMNMQQTSAHIGKLTKGVNVAFEINPPAFDRFNVKSVPTLVVYHDDPLYEAKCATGQQPEKSKDVEHFEGTVGDVSIGYSIEKLLDNPETQFRPYLERLEKKLVNIDL